MGRSRFESFIGRILKIHHNKISDKHRPLLLAFENVLWWSVGCLLRLIIFKEISVCTIENFHDLLKNDYDQFKNHYMYAN